MNLCCLVLPKRLSLLIVLFQQRVSRKRRGEDESRGLSEGLERAGVALGIGGSGAITKQISKAKQDVQRGIERDISGLGAAEAQALEQRAEFGRQRDFQAGESKLQRDLIASQANKDRQLRREDMMQRGNIASAQLDELKRQFDREFDQNRLTLFGNLIASLDEANIGTNDWREWADQLIAGMGGGLGFHPSSFSPAPGVTLTRT